MRHRNAGRTLGRTSTHRLALFRNLTRALFEHGRINTTVAKLKEFSRKKDEKGAMAAFNESSRLRPNDPSATLAFAMGLVALGRPAEGVQTIVSALARFPAWGDDPRLLLRHGAACAAVNCADS